MAVKRIFRTLFGQAILISGLVLPAQAIAFDLGVQTHFAQGWQMSLQDQVAQAGTRHFRDGIHWSTIETAPGAYDFTSVQGWLDSARSKGKQPLLVFAGANPLYDNGETPHSAEGQAAFARYVAATLRAFPDLTPRIELGNEYNAPNFLSGPFEKDPAASFARLAAAVRAEVKAVSPATEILCTGAHSVALAYFRGVFAAGGLDHCDAISLHPYRADPEGLTEEIAALRALMAEYGPVKPIYATEFGKWFEDPDEAPVYMLKMVTLMAASDLAGAWWYALVDEPWWPNMGLLDADLAAKPAAPAFQTIAKTLLPLGAPRRVRASPADHIYEFGTGGRGFVVWGPSGKLLVEGQATFHDARGVEIAPVNTVSDAPVILLGDGLQVTIARDVPGYDSLLGFGTAPWSYLAIDRNGTETPLVMLETNWTPVRGNRYLRPLGVTSSAIAGVVFDGAPVAAVERFTAPAAGKYRIDAQWAAEKAEGDGAVVTVRVDGEKIARGSVLTDPLILRDIDVELTEGGFLDFSVDPNTAPGGDVVVRRIHITGPIGPAG